MCIVVYEKEVLRSAKAGTAMQNSITAQSAAHAIFLMVLFIVVFLLLCIFKGVLILPDGLVIFSIGQFCDTDTRTYTGLIPWRIRDQSCLRFVAREVVANEAGAAVGIAFVVNIQTVCYKERFAVAVNCEEVGDFVVNI